MGDEENPTAPAADASGLARLGLKRKKKAVDTSCLDPRPCLFFICQPAVNALDCVFELMHIAVVPILCPIYAVMLCILKVLSFGNVTGCAPQLYAACNCKVDPKRRKEVKLCSRDTYTKRFGEDSSGLVTNLVNADGSTKFESFSLTGGDPDKHEKMLHNLDLLDELRRLPSRTLKSMATKDAPKKAKMNMVFLYLLGLVDVITDFLFCFTLAGTSGVAGRVLLPVGLVFSCIGLFVYMKDLADKKNKEKILIVTELLHSVDIDLPVWGYVINDINKKYSFLFEDIPQIGILVAFVIIRKEPLDAFGALSYWFSSISVIAKTDISLFFNCENICFSLKYLAIFPFYAPFMALEALYFSCSGCCCCGEPAKHFRRITTMAYYHVIPFLAVSVLSFNWIALSFIFYFTFLS